MKQTILLVAFFFTINLAFAQFGITGRYHFNKAPDWVPFWADTDDKSLAFLGDGWSVGIDYWMRLKNYRIEFLPELNYSQFQNTMTQNEVGKADFSNQFYNFYLNTNFYLFDFLGDCNCPTFSKQGELLKKGFFLQVSPGISYLQNEFQLPEIPYPDGKAQVKSNAWSFSVGAGAGIDIGISDFVTITPVVSLRYFPNAEWQALTSYTAVREAQPVSEESSIWQLSAGARLGFRLDYKSKGRRR